MLKSLYNNFVYVFIIINKNNLCGYKISLLEKCKLFYNYMLEDLYN